MERWIQFLGTTDYQSCNAPFSELFTVLKQTVIDSLVLRIQLSHHLFILWFRENASEPGCAFGVCWLTPLVCLQNSKNKWSFQMIHANKAGEEQITKGHHVGSDRLSVCALLYMCVCACVSLSVKQPRGPKGWSSCVPKTKWRPLKRHFSLLVLSLLPWLLHYSLSLDLYELAVLLQAFSEP